MLVASADLIVLVHLPERLRREQSRLEIFLFPDKLGRWQLVHLSLPHDFIDTGASFLTDLCPYR